MLLLFLLCMGVAAEWPPTTCSRNAVVTSTGVQLTSGSTDESECRLTQAYEEEVYLGLTRKYNDQNRNYRGILDSKVVVTVADIADTALFDVEIHSDKIHALGSRCFGVFELSKRWELKLAVHSFADLQKSVVGIHTARHGRGFRRCAEFELEQTVPRFKLRIRATTESGMDQWVHEVRTAPVAEPQRDKTMTQLQALETKVDTLSTKMQQLEQRLTRNNLVRIKSLGEVHAKHKELKEHVNTAQSRTAMNIQHYSYMSWSLFALVVIFGGAALKFIQYYIRKRDKII